MYGQTLERAKTLLLNADARPISSLPLSLIPWRKSVEGVYKNKVVVMENWDNLYVHSVSEKLPVPKVVMSKVYIPQKNVKLPLSRLTLAIRDGFCCQYCSEKLPLKDLTFDHVMPRSKGGKNTHDNLVLSCMRCNVAKGNSIGKYKPKRTPYQPSFNEIYSKGFNFVPYEIKKHFCDWLPDSLYSEEVLTEEFIESQNWDADTYWTATLFG